MAEEAGECVKSFKVNFWLLSLIYSIQMAIGAFVAVVSSYSDCSSCFPERASSWLVLNKLSNKSQ